MDFVELAGYGGRSTGASAVRLLKDLDADILDRDVLVVEDVVDTGLTLNYLTKSFALRSPRSLAVVTLLDRPYRRLVDDLPVRYVGFTAPDEFSWATASTSTSGIGTFRICTSPGSSYEISQRVLGTPLTRTSKWRCGPVDGRSSRRSRSPDLATNTRRCRRRGPTGGRTRVATPPP